MNVGLLQDALDRLGGSFTQDGFIFDLLAIFGIPKSTIKILRSNPSKLSGNKNQIILKNKLFFHQTTIEEDEHVVIDSLQKEQATYKFNPRFIIVTDFVTFLAIDTKTKETLDIDIKDLGKHYAFFLPWCGMEKSQHVNENPADIRAAYKMDKLYQAIVTDDPEHYKKNSHDLNIFLSRLLFCFFAEDTAIFPKVGMFTDSITSHTYENGEEMDTYFSTLFDVLNTEDSDRLKFASHFLKFPYVNGGLFEDKIKLPKFTTSSRKLIIECGKLNWDSINPDIFGSMIQAVVHPGQREHLGMHYTSVPNIMKVIEPLFLNDLYRELENSKDDARKLTNLRERVARIKIFDPACGSGNFLIISYKELCRLEIKILQILSQSNNTESLKGEGGFVMTTQSSVSLNNFYGIEIDDFASQIARLSLYLAQHQVNLEFEKEFGKLKPILPLKESGNIEHKNATRIEWDKVCPRVEYGIDGKSVLKQHEIYIVGNPPYLGSRNQDDNQKDDLKHVFDADFGKLDYVSNWFYLGAQYITGHNIRLAFVSTNSIIQGEQVSILWPRVLSNRLEINFAYQSFKWQNNAKNNAGVSVVIIGLCNKNEKVKKYLYVDNYAGVISVNEINPYLAAAPTLYINSESHPISNLPEMVRGNYTGCCGALILSKNEKDELLKKNPRSEKYIKKFVGSEEFISGNHRYCLWISDVDLVDAEKIPDILLRINQVKKERLNSSDKGQKSIANKAHQFREFNSTKTLSILVPIVSSEKRRYIPCGFVGSDTIVPNSAQVIYDPEPYIFSILNSRMHMAWVRGVSGKLEDRLRYSSSLCYNTFPFPDITPKQKESLTSHVYNILEEREKYPEKTMADLYDPDKMPDGLREAHKYLDLAIDQIYRSKPFESDEDRLAHLFKLYEEMITREINK